MKTEEEYESEAQKLLSKLKQNPMFDLMTEYGSLLMRHINSYTPEERKRYDELTAILANSGSMTTEKDKARVKKTGIYPLVGLSKPRSATLTGPKDDFFWAEIIMPEDRIQALWNYCESNWDEPKFAKLEYTELSSDGFPIDAVMIELVL